MIQLLLDANLSWRMAKPLAAHFGHCIHLNRTELGIYAEDDQIWEYAKRHVMHIITRDDDFLKILDLRGAPPKLIMLCSQNESWRKMVSKIVDRSVYIDELHESTQLSLLEIY